MKLYEYMAKEIFRNHGIVIPKGCVFSSPEGIKKYVETIGSVVIKSQVLAGGRGKAGGIKFADTPEEAVVRAKELFASQLKGSSVNELLVEEKLKIDQEIYLGLTIDRAHRRPVLLASKAGGMEIEQVSSELIIKRLIDVSVGVQPYTTREISRRLGVSGEVSKKLSDLLVKLYQIFVTYDAELVEINPLVISGTDIYAADAKMTLDDDASFRFRSDIPHVEEKTELEKKASAIGIAYVDLEGEIGVMANGAGITMATLDLIKDYGMNARNFMDAGGGASRETVAQALEILLSTKPKSLLINIFGGITRCDEVAKAFIDVKKSVEINIPVVIRLVGTNEEAGIEILQANGIESYKNVKDAVTAVVALTQKKGAYHGNFDQ